MAGPSRSIYRAEAVRRYLQTREKSVLPRFVVPRVTALLWVLLGMLAASGLIVLLPLVDQLLQE